MSHPVWVLGVLILLLAGASGTAADVVDSSGNGFTVRTTITISADPQAVYRSLVEEVGICWHPDHTFSGVAKNLSIEAEANGCFCETLPGGGSVRHMTDVFASPGKLLRMTGGLGPLQGMAVAGSMSWKLSEVESAAELELSYSVGGYHPAGLQELAPVVDAVLTDQIRRLKDHVEGREP
jgi:hypothetical protein